MPIQPTYPGVYVQEVSSGVRTITGVTTSIAAFVGMVNRGRVNIPTRVLSFTDYERKYGNDTTVSEMTDQVRQFFFNGGQQAFIMRIANGATSCEEPPGIREGAAGKLYLAYLRDPDGNKICAMHRIPA